jgi:hypothetical protein
MKLQILIPLLAGVVLLAACKGKGGSYEVVNNASADSVKFDSAKADQAKLVKIANARFKVKNVQKTSEAIAALTTGYSGMVMHHETSSTAERSEDIRISNDSVMRVTAFNTTATMIVKIPSEKLEEFMNNVAAMGVYVNNRTMDITDKSFDYLSAQLKLKSRRELVSQQKTGKVIIKNPANVLALKDDMVDQQVNNREIDDAVKNSIVSLGFYESNTINKEIIANDDPSAYNLPFFKRLAMAAQNGWVIFVDLMVAITNLWVLAVAAILVWVIVRNIRKRLVVKTELPMSN